MADPIIILTASAIANLAFQEFIKSGAGELAKKFTAEALAKIPVLWEKIKTRLTGRLKTRLTGRLIVGWVHQLS